MSRVPPQTTKQAKAAHKARKQVGLSEAQRRAVQRDSLLHRRAWATKERERSNLIAAQRRAEKAQQERSDESHEARFATQRRVDRFGHKSSQFHLGAYFTTRLPSQPKGMIMAEQQDWSDPEVDDDDILSGLKTPNMHSTLQHSPRAPGSPSSRRDDDTQTFGEDGGRLKDPNSILSWCDFDTSTQIARDLDADSVSANIVRSTARKRSPESTMSSLGLTSQDIEGLDPSTTFHSQVQPNFQSKACSIRSRPEQKLLPQLDGPADLSFGFSNTQLEACVDEEVILTQT